MVLIQLKSMPVQITILFLFAVVWAMDVEATDSTDPSKEDVEATDSTDPSKEDVEATDSTDPSKEDVEATDSTDPSKEDSKNQTIFLTRREACDFLRIGDMFENPEHHMDLAYEYFDMEETGYWGMRCEEKKARGDAVERLGYCA